MEKITISKSYLEDLLKWAKYGRLLPGIIHNINSPIMGVTGRVDLIKFKNPEVKGLDKLDESLLKIQEIIQNLVGILETDNNTDLRNVRIKTLVNSLDSLYQADMRYKHSTDVVNNLESLSPIYTNPTIFQNSLIEIINFYLSHIDKESYQKHELSFSGKENDDEITFIISTDISEIKYDISDNEEGINSIENIESLGLFMASEMLKKINYKLNLKKTNSGYDFIILIPKNKRGD